MCPKKVGPSMSMSKRADQPICPKCKEDSHDMIEEWDKFRQLTCKVCGHTWPVPKTA